MEEEEDAVPRAPHHTKERHEEIGEAAKENEAVQVLALGLAADADEQDLRVIEREKGHSVREDDQENRNVEEAHLEEESIREIVANPRPAGDARSEHIPDAMTDTNRIIAEALHHEEQSAGQHRKQPTEELVPPMPRGYLAVMQDEVISSAHCHNTQCTNGWRSSNTSSNSQCRKTESRSPRLLACALMRVPREVERMETGREARRGRRAEKKGSRRSRRY